VQCPSPSAPIFTNLKIQATRPPQSKNRGEKYPFGAPTPNLEPVPRGDAGSGKSRLTVALLQRLAGDRARDRPELHRPLDPAPLAGLFSGIPTARSASLKGTKGAAARGSRGFVHVSAMRHT